MAVLLALVAAGAYGAGDFAGGIASKRHPTVAVVLVAQALGLGGLVAATVVLPPAGVTGADLAWGALSGLAGVLGLALLYEGLATGVMSVVSPVTAVCAAVVPVVVGVGLGEVPSPLAWAGIVVGAMAVALLGLAPGPFTTGTGSTTRATAMAVAAGVAFGAFFVLLDRTGADSALVPLVAARAASVSALVATVAVRRTVVAWRDRTLSRPAGVAGVMDTAANVAFLLATRRGMLAIVALCVALYPATTVLLARLVLHERLARSQTVGLVLAAGAVVLVVV